MTTVITDPMAKVKLPRHPSTVTARDRDVYDILHAAMLRGDLYGWSVPAKGRWYVWLNEVDYRLYRDAPDQARADGLCPPRTVAEVRQLIAEVGWTNDRSPRSNLLPPRGGTALYRDPDNSYQNNAKRWPPDIGAYVRACDALHPKGTSCTTSSNSPIAVSSNGKAPTSSTPPTAPSTAIVTPPSSPPARPPLNATASISGDAVRASSNKPRRKSGEPDTDYAARCATVTGSVWFVWLGWKKHAVADRAPASRPWKAFLPNGQTVYSEYGRTSAKGKDRLAEVRRHLRDASPIIVAEPAEPDIACELAAAVVAEAERITHQPPSPSTLPAEVVEWLDRLVYADKRVYAEAYARAILLGSAMPTDPATDWARKARARFDRIRYLAASDI